MPKGFFMNYKNNSWEKGEKKKNHCLQMVVHLTNKAKGLCRKPENQLAINL